MGCFDIYCIICGNSYWNEIINLIDRPNSYIDENNEEMNAFFKKFNKLATKDIDILLKQLVWLEKCTILTTDNKVIHDCKEMQCNYVFMNKQDKKNVYISHYNPTFQTIDSMQKIGIFIHTDCWNFIKNKYGIELQFKDIPIKPNYNYNYNYVEGINYSTITKYWTPQFTKYIKMFLDNNIWMAISPLDNSNKKNNARIKKIVSQFKFKNNRIGPSTSASFYDDKTIKFGNNEKFWIKKHGKWNQINEKIIKLNISKTHIKKNLYTVLNKIPSIGEFNVKQLFIYKNNKKYIELIGTEQTLKKIIVR
jgi:hypothetical protein